MRSSMPRDSRTSSTCRAVDLSSAENVRGLGWRFVRRDLGLRTLELLQRIQTEFCVGLPYWIVGGRVCGLGFECWMLGLCSSRHSGESGTIAYLPRHCLSGTIDSEDNTTTTTKTKLHKQLQKQGWTQTDNITIAITQHVCIEQP